MWHPGRRVEPVPTALGSAAWCLTGTGSPQHHSDGVSVFRPRPIPPIGSAQHTARNVARQANLVAKAISNQGLFGDTAHAVFCAPASWRVGARTGHYALVTGRPATARERAFMDALFDHSFEGVESLRRQWEGAHV
jgi:hypothetical protein